MAKIPLVAVVDDDDAFREALCELLIVAGLDCRAFPGVPEFFANHVEGGFDCLITDLRMPGMSGIDLLEQLRASDRAIPAIILTSVHDPRERSQLGSLGVHAWLTKPVAGEILFGHIKTVLEGGGYSWPDDPDA